jgi:hypothetical protein
MAIQKITIGNVSVDLNQVDQLLIVKLHHALSWSVTCLLAIVGVLVALFGGGGGVSLSIAVSLVIAAISSYYFAPLATYSVRVLYINGRSVDLECLSNDDAAKVKSRLDALVRNEKE